MTSSLHFTFAPTVSHDLKGKIWPESLENITCFVLDFTGETTGVEALKLKTNLGCLYGPIIKQHCTTQSPSCTRKSKLRGHNMHAKEGLYYTTLYCTSFIVLAQLL